MITRGEKNRIIESLKLYKDNPHCSQGPISNVYSWNDILFIIMGGPYEATTEEILQRLIDLMEA